MTIRNNYALEMLLAWVEGLSILGFLGFLFFDWKTSVACLGVFLLAIPARNFVKYGQLYPGKAVKPMVAPKVVVQQSAAPAVSPVAPLVATQPRTTV